MTTVAVDPPNSDVDTDVSAGADTGAGRDGAGRDGARRDDAATATQEIRVAAVLNGGVSLAVWMSGVTLELHHLALASRGLGDGRWASYREVLRLLKATARVDVIAGTSAGGLNGAFLALGLARCRDFGLLRDVWVEQGSLEKLMRPALEKNPPSPLRGDQFFLPRIHDALSEILAPDNRELGAPDAADRPPVELILTGTLWNGRASSFADDMGVTITEHDYDATFRFANRQGGGPHSTGDLDTADTDALIAQLASAARCTSSFPGAFEPHYVTTTPGEGAVPGRWPSSAGQSNFAESQYVLDGGVLLNKPIRPALDAIYRQSAENQVRRVLAYVVPDPGGDPQPAASGAHAEQPPTPVAADVLLSVMTRLKSTDSVSRELAEIRDTNAAVADRRRARTRLAAAMTEALAPEKGSPTDLATLLYPGYLVERRESACRTIGALIASGQAPGPAAWSTQELVDALRRVASGPGFGFVPQDDLATALTAAGPSWRWGQTTLVHIGDIVSDVLRRALALAPMGSAQQPGPRRRIVAARRLVAGAVNHIAEYNSSLTTFWQSAPQHALPLGPIPDREVFAATSGSSSARNLAELDAWLAALIPEWDASPTGPDAAAAPPADSLAAGRRTGQLAAALQVAEVLRQAADAIAAILGAPNPAMTGDDGAAVSELRSLRDWLLTGSTDAAEVLRRILRLEVVQVASGSAFTSVEQRVELVQVSCTDRDRIAGMQLHHFGAFYRAPWRVNDWIEGRHDGARQVMRFLLSPERLRQCGYTADEVLAALADIAAPAGHPYADWLRACWADGLPDYRREVALAMQAGAGATALDAVATALARPVVLDSLPGDLEALAASIRGEGSDAPRDSLAWLARYESPDRSASDLERGQRLWDLYERIDLIGRQKISDDVGSDTFARTVSHAAVIATGSFAAPSSKLGRLKAVSGVLGSLRGYAAVVWAMVTFLTRGSEFGARAVQLAVAAGGVLLAVAVIVPGVPSGLTVLGAVLFLAGASAAALLTRHAFWMGVRVLIAAVAVAAVGGYPTIRYLHQHGFDRTAQSVVVKLGVGVLVVFLGWFIAWNGRRLSITRASVRWRGVVLGAGAGWWSVVTIVLLHQADAHAANTHERVWSHTAGLALLLALTALVQVLVYGGSVGTRPWARTLVLLTLLALGGAAASAVLHLTRHSHGWAAGALDWFGTAALALVAVLVVIAVVRELHARVVAAVLGLLAPAAVLAAWAVAPHGHPGVTVPAIALGAVALAAGIVLVCDPDGAGARA